MFAFSTVLLVLIKYAASAHDTTCEEDQKHFADVCFTPTPLTTFDINWFKDAQPADGWFTPMKNDISRLHFAEILRGRLLTLQDNYANSCFRVKASFGEVGLKANVSGFNNLHGLWECKLSQDTFGVFICDGTTDGPEKFHEKFHFYPIFADNKNFLVGVSCFPNGQAGWSVHSTTPTLTEEEKKMVAEKINEVGFVYDDHVVTYDESCMV